MSVHATNYTTQHYSAIYLNTLRAFKFTSECDLESEPVSDSSFSEDKDPIEVFTPVERKFDSLLPSVSKHMYRLGKRMYYTFAED